MTTSLAAIPLESVLAFGGKLGIFIVALAALIFVHELGHFLVARRTGVLVEKFSLGFGPRLIGIKRGDTEYMISAFPLGGYVKMKGEDPEEELTDTRGSFSSAPVKHRLAIAFAGPFFNILFAVLIYIVVYTNGVPTLAPVVGSVKSDSPAETAGLKPGDRIVEVDGEKIDFWEQLQDAVHKSPGRKVELALERDSKQLITLSVTPVAEEITNLFGEKEKVGLIGISPLVRNITGIHEGSPAEKAGLKTGDRLIAIDGKPILGWPDLKEAAIDKPGEELLFKVARDDAEMEFKLTPERKQIEDEDGKPVAIGIIGISMGGEMALEQYGLLRSVARAFEETGRLIYLIALSLKKMIVGSIPADSIGGPILIFQIYGEQARQGFNELIRLTALLSINLGLLNLLPIPILDGGHIFFFLLEAVKGRPVSEKSRERAQQVGLVMLISLMIFAFYNDIARIME